MRETGSDLLSLGVASALWTSMENDRIRQDLGASISIGSGRQEWPLACLCLAAAAVLGIGLAAGRGVLVCISPALLLVLLAIVRQCSSPWTRYAPGVVGVLLASALLAQLGSLYRSAPAGHVQSSPTTTYYVALASMAAVTIVMLAASKRVRGLLTPALLAAFVIAGCWLLRAVPEPHIDVFVYERQGARELLAGRNPYAMTFPNIYGAAAYNAYGVGLVDGDRLRFGFPYPPLALWLTTLGEALVGDPRYAQLTAMALAAGLMVLANGGWVGTGAAALFLISPVGLYVLENAWTEPLVLLFFAGSVFCALHRPRALPFVLGLLLVSKQYVVLLLPLLPLLVPGRVLLRRRFLVSAALTATMVTVPLAIIDLPAFLHSVVALQFRQPFRPDSVSYLVWWSKGGHPPPSAARAFLAAGAAIALALWRAPRTPAGFAAASALVFLVFFAFSKQAFTNYYSFVIGTLCTAAAAARLPELERHRRPCARPCD